MELQHRDEGRQGGKDRAFISDLDLNYNQLLHHNREVPTEVELPGEHLVMNVGHITHQQIKT